MEMDVFNFEDFLGKNPIQENKKDSELKEVQSDVKDEETTSEEIVKELPYQTSEDDVEEIVNDVIEEKLNESYKGEEEDDDKYYPLYLDKSEVFSCDIMIEGADIDETLTRLIIETDEWTLMFPGEIQSNKVNIPIRKLNIFKEGEIGKIKLEVIAEGTQFIPWEDDFKIKRSKTVQVSVNEKKSHKKIQESKTNVKVKVRK